MKNDESRVDVGLPEASVHPYTVAMVDIKICSELYAKWSHKKRMYNKCPADGLPVRVEYADTLGMRDARGDKISLESSVVVALHGAPGSHEDFTLLIMHLAASGHRVVAPNFPSKFIST